MDVTRLAVGAGIVLLVLVGLAVAFVAMIWATQRGMLYFPDDRAVPTAASVTPGAEDVTFETEDGLRLRGWFVPAREPHAAVLVFNGNAGNRSDRAPLAESLVREGLSVLLFDYRGYGGNPGSPTETGLMQDARAARAYLATRVDADRIAYLGESLGAAVAVALAAEHAPLALILRSPFTSLLEIGAHHYPYLPVHPLLLQDHWASVDRIGRIDAPVLVIAGERDGVVPQEFSRRLYDAARRPSGYVLIRAADHNDPELQGTAVIDEVARVIREAAR